VPTASFEPVPESARGAREFVRACLAGGAVPDRDLAVLLVSVLATNAIMHSRLTFDVSVEMTARCVQIAVTDLSAVLPTPRTDVDFAERGLTMVAAEADRWGIEATNGGKRAWFELCRGARPT
jgi:hypothetical protein